MYSYFIHVALLMLGAPRSGFKSLATLFGYIWGLMFPLNFVISLPLLFAIGPEYLFSGNAGFVDEVSQQQLQLFAIVGILGAVLFIWIWLNYVFSWLPKVLKIPKAKLLLALLLGGLPAGLIIGFLFGPLFNWLEKILGAWL
jgi:hypothetical protein